MIVFYKLAAKLHGFTWYTWPHKEIFQIKHLTIIFLGKLQILTRVVQELNLNQIDG